MNRYGLKGKNILITGGTSGIGLASARLALADGARVSLLGRSVERGQAALTALSEFAGSVDFYSVDVSQGAVVAKVRQFLQAKGEAVDLLLNSAGIYTEKSLEFVTEEEYYGIMDVNVKGTVFMCQAVLPYLSKEGAAIINIGSDAGVEGNYGCPLYCASKGAIVAFTKALALDLAPRVRVNCVCPADVATPLVMRQLAAGGYSEADMAACYPLGRIAQPEEIAHVVCAVASPYNSFMTGAIINVDGGLTAK